MQAASKVISRAQGCLTWLTRPQSCSCTSCQTIIGSGHGAEPLSQQAGSLLPCHACTAPYHLRNMPTSPIHTRSLVKMLCCADPVRIAPGQQKGRSQACREVLAGQPSTHAGLDPDSGARLHEGHHLPLAAFADVIRQGLDSAPHSCHWTAAADMSPAVTQIELPATTVDKSHWHTNF